MSQLIVISGMMGSGKSTMTSKLREAIPNSMALHEDDFNPAPLRSLEQIDAWWAKGGRVDEFDLSALIHEIEARHTEVVGTIILESQFGRLHSALRPWIDLQCWIDVEADVAFARKVSQLSRQFLADEDAPAPEQALLWLAGFAESYVQTTRKLFKQQRTRVAALSDLVIPGDGSIDEVLSRLLRELPPQLFSHHVETITAGPEC